MIRRALVFVRASGKRSMRDNGSPQLPRRASEVAVLACDGTKVAFRCVLSPFTLEHLEAKLLEQQMRCIFRPRVRSPLRIEVHRR